MTKRWRGKDGEIIELGYCHCGCGQKTNLRAGEPYKFRKGHHIRVMQRPERVDYQVDPETGCWVWIRSSTKQDGYARVRQGGGNAKLAHRVYYERYVGPIPEGLCIDHLCRNRACVNPEHLEAVTWRENILRGEGQGAKQARQTHCKNGHPLSGDNLYVYPDGRKRGCRACRKNARK